MVLRQGAAHIFTQGSAGFCQPEHIPWTCCYQHLSQLVQSYPGCVHSSFMALGSSVDMGCSNVPFEIRISSCWSHIGTSSATSNSSCLVWLWDSWKGGWMNSQWDKLVMQGSLKMQWRAAQRSCKGSGMAGRISAACAAAPHVGLVPLATTSFAVALAFSCSLAGWSTLL